MGEIVLMCSSFSSHRAPQVGRQMTGLWKGIFFYFLINFHERNHMSYMLVMMTANLALKSFYVFAGFRLWLITIVEDI